MGNLTISLTKFVCFLSYLMICTLANTTTENQQREARIAACRDLDASLVPFPDPECWDILNMSKWMETWNTSTTICTSLQDLLTPCQCFVGEVWMTCFMRLTFEGIRTADYQCTNISMLGSCSKPAPHAIVQGPAEIYYGSFSIWGKMVYHIEPIKY